LIEQEFQLSLSDA